MLAGTFNRVYFRSFPGEYPRASIYINLSDFCGRHNISFRFVSLADGTVIDHSPEFELCHDDRREHHECIIELSALEFPGPGRFTLEILYDGDFIGHADIEALPMPAPEYSDEE